VFLYSIFGDRWWWLFLLNSFIIYAFLPLPIVLIIAVVTHQRVLWVGCSSALVLVIYLYGGLFIPKYTAAEAHNGLTLTVMAYNVLGYNTNTQGVVDAIHASGADVVALQELNPRIAKAIQEQLKEVYPYQELHPLHGTSGSGVISRYAMKPFEESLPESIWNRDQYLLTKLDVHGREVLFLRFHAVPTNLGRGDSMDKSLRKREQQAVALADFARSYMGTLIAAGDFNATDTSVAYATMTTALRDSWREAGWGLGNTFPGGTAKDNSRLKIAGFHVPQWLVRIDYIFHSNDLETVSTRIGPWDGQSDHRPVMATFSLQ